MKKLLVVGEINVDLVLQGYHDFPAPGKEVLVDDFSMVLGSASAICAMGLARLGDPVAFLGKVGDDPLGRFCVEAMRERRIDVSRVVVDARLKTGVTVAITSSSDRALVSFLGSISALVGADVPPTVFHSFDHLHISSYFMQERLRPAIRGLFAEARRLGLTTSLDPHPRCGPGRGPHRGERRLPGTWAHPAPRSRLRPERDLGPRSVRHPCRGRCLLSE